MACRACDLSGSEPGASQLPVRSAHVHMSVQVEPQNLRRSGRPFAGGIRPWVVVSFVSGSCIVCLTHNVHQRSPCVWAETRAGRAQLGCGMSAFDGLSSQCGGMDVDGDSKVPLAEDDSLRVVDVSEAAGGRWIPVDRVADEHRELPELGCLRGWGQRGRRGRLRAGMALLVFRHGRMAYISCFCGNGFLGVAVARQVQESWAQHCQAIRWARRKARAEPGSPNSEGRPMQKGSRLRNVVSGRVQWKGPGCRLFLKRRRPVRAILCQAIRLAWRLSASRCGTVAWRGVGAQGARAATSYPQPFEQSLGRLAHGPALGRCVKEVEG